MTSTRLLHVEDDEANRALVHAIVARSPDERMRDVHVTAVGTLAQARTELAARDVDLVLLDMRLPDGSGLQLASELRERDGPRPVVVALTGAAAEQGARAIAAGCAAVLAKPYRPAELCGVIAAHLPSGRPAPGHVKAWRAHPPGADQSGRG